MYSLLILLAASLTLPLLVPSVFASTNQTDNEDTKNIDEEAVALIESTQSEKWDGKDDTSDSGDISTVSSSNNDN